MIPSCWGALHIRLDDQSAQERAEFLQFFSETLENRENN